MIQTERDNRKKRIKAMKKAKKWGKHRQIFEKETCKRCFTCVPFYNSARPKSVGEGELYPAARSDARWRVEGGSEGGGLPLSRQGVSW